MQRVIESRQERGDELHNMAKGIAMRYVFCGAIICISVVSLSQTAVSKPQFDVASIRQVKPGSGLPPKMMEFMRNERHPGEIPMAGADRVRLRSWTLLDLIAAAYVVAPAEVSGPGWLSDQIFDLEAEVPLGTPKDELNAMLQSLLEARFDLKIHRSTVSERGFALMVDKGGPKLKAAVPPPARDPTLTEEEETAEIEQKMKAKFESDRRRSQADFESGKATTVTSTESWASITTKELAVQLGRHMGTHVIDKTGLTEKYSVTIATSNNVDTKSEVISDAVKKLGLRLEPLQVTAERVVVDQISREPNPN